MAAMSFLVCTTAIGCGYRMVGSGGDVAVARSVAVKTPSNESFEPGVEITVARALRREALRRGGVTLVEDPEAADVVLSGRVLPLLTRARSFSSVVLTLEYQLTLEVELDAELQGGETLSFDRDGLRETERYLASADIEATRKNRQEALRLISQAIATRVYDSIELGAAQ